MKNYLVESMTSLYGNLNEAISGWNEDEYLHFAYMVDFDKSLK